MLIIVKKTTDEEIFWFQVTKVIRLVWLHKTNIDLQILLQFRYNRKFKKIIGISSKPKKLFRNSIQCFNWRVLIFHVTKIWCPRNLFLNQVHLEGHLVNGRIVNCIWSILVELFAFLWSSWNFANKDMQKRSNIKKLRILSTSICVLRSYPTFRLAKSKPSLGVSLHNLNDFPWKKIFQLSVLCSFRCA